MLWARMTLGSYTWRQEPEYRLTFYRTDVTSEGPVFAFFVGMFLAVIIGLLGLVVLPTHSTLVGLVAAGVFLAVHALTFYYMFFRDTDNLEYVRVELSDIPDDVRHRIAEGFARTNQDSWVRVSFRDARAIRRNEKARLEAGRKYYRDREYEAARSILFEGK